MGHYFLDAQYHGYLITRILINAYATIQGHLFIHFLLDLSFTISMSKKWPILCSNLLYKMGHYFFDIQYLKHGHRRFLRAKLLYVLSVFHCESLKFWLIAEECCFSQKILWNTESIFWFFKCFLYIFLKTFLRKITFSKSKEWFFAYSRLSSFSIYLFAW